MPDIPDEAIEEAVMAIMSAANMNDDEPERFESRMLARAALEAAAPLLADKIASAILRYADDHEPLTGSGVYIAWHRHFEAASSVAANAFGRDNLEAAAPAAAVREDEGP